MEARASSQSRKPATMLAYVVALLWEPFCKVHRQPGLNLSPHVADLIPLKMDADFLFSSSLCIQIRKMSQNSFKIFTVFHGGKKKTSKQPTPAPQTPQPSLTFSNGGPWKNGLNLVLFF